MSYFEPFDDRPATQSDAHLEWHRNAGVPVGQPCPWDACDPYAGLDDGGCLNVHHDAVSCDAAGIPTAEWCEPCLADRAPVPEPTKDDEEPF